MASGLFEPSDHLIHNLRSRQNVALGRGVASDPVCVATSPRAFMTENWRPSLVHRSGRGSGSTPSTRSTT